ncbi:UNVERIFIED_CONTAM: hypothetical protein GTU68_061096 [Idotea baltica]|nr:hypothetical protein [Idotea baltica]
MQTFKIGDRMVGTGHPTFIIAEAGVNHNGDPELAKRLIDIAVEAGADAVKFQTFKAKDGMTQAGTMYDMVKRLELDYSVFVDLKQYCDEKGIMFLSSPHTPDATPFLADLVPTFKIGSGDLNNLPFLAEAARYGLPMILGTGMATLAEVEEAIQAIRDAGGKDIAVLHCTTSYPCAMEDVNLRAMQTMQQELDVMVGYSDHTPGITVPIMAVTMGAPIIEKHFTIHKKMDGPDHKASLNPAELRGMISCIREAEKALGSTVKTPTAKEIEIKPLVRKSIVANVPIPAGTVISAEMLITKRPGTGIEPKAIVNVVGKTAARDIEADTLILPEDLT